MTETLELFEQFLERYHESGGDIETLCREHPERAERFRGWWDALVRTGEVSSSASPAVEALPEEGSIFGAYKIVRELGRGSQGTVYLAEDTRLEGRPVALKVLPEYRMRGRDRARRFAREAELASRLDHPGLCTVYERGTMEKTAFLAMRFVEGTTLAGLVAAQRRRVETGSGGRAVRIDGEERDESRAVQTVLETFERIGAALHAAHEAKLIHRDVKPGNVIVDGTGHPVLLDFGLARDVEEEELTLTGDLVGTPAYMSPEQIAAQRIELDHRTDVYSLGATLFECLTLRRPFEAPTRNELYQEILTAEAPDARRFNRAIPRDLAVVLRTALEKDRKRRYQSARDLADELARVRRHEPIRARPAGPLLRLQRWAQRNPAVAVSTAAIFLALSIGLVVSLWFHAEAQRARAGFRRLADAAELDQAREVAASLDRSKWATARLALDIESWLQRYGWPLRDRLPAHRAELERLRRDAEPEDPNDRKTHPRRPELDRLRRDLDVFATMLANAPGARQRARAAASMDELRRRIAEVEAVALKRHVWRFAQVERQITHDALSRLVSELDRFTGEEGLLGRLERRLRWLRTVEERTVGAYAERWQKACEEVRADGRYGGRELTPQPGLVPLGPDPRSRLQEFAFLRSGAVPERDGADALRIDGASALVFVLVPAGEFQMGLRAPAFPNWETSPGRIALDWYFCSKYEMTRGQWTRLAGEEVPAALEIASVECDGPEYPIESVSWVEADRVLRPFGLQLPTEAQWEYATRGGTKTLNWWLAVKRPRLAPANLRDARYLRARKLDGANQAHDDGFAFLAPVDTLAPNPFGLHHVIGNVSEWCRESFFRVPLGRLPKPTTEDGFFSVPHTGSRTVRGGSFERRLRQVYSAARTRRRETNRHLGVGLRPVRRVE